MAKYYPPKPFVKKVYHQLETLLARVRGGGDERPIYVMQSKLADFTTQFILSMRCKHSSQVAAY